MYEVILKAAAMVVKASKADDLPSAFGNRSLYTHSGQSSAQRPRRKIIAVIEKRERATWREQCAPEMHQ
jgi:hypothetical protein